MKINSITLENYRNIEALSLDFDNVNIIWGENAQGKTNLVEAIYLFTGGKSFRSTKDSQLIKFDAEKSNLKIDFFANNREQNAEIEIKEKRRGKLNGISKRSCAELGKEIKAVIFSPVHLNMIKDGPSERRKFVDASLCQLSANYRNLLKEYNRALVQRNILLKNCRDDMSQKAMISVWNENLAKCGAKIIYQRLKYIEAITPFVKDIFLGISSGKEEIDLKYIGADDFEIDLKGIEEKLFKCLENHINIDISAGTTTKGPHRDDVDILINGNSARIYGSQGQQRSCVLAIKLAEASLLKQITDLEPIVLLDDVMSELDIKRQDYILNHIKNWQVFITCCDKNTILRLKQGKTFHIENGCLLEE